MSDFQGSGTPPPGWGTPPPGGAQTPPPGMASGGSSPGVPAPAAKSKTPAILLGVFGALTLFSSCLPFAGAAYLYSESEDHRDSARYYESSGSGGYGGYGDDSYLAGSYRRQADEEEQMSMGSGCCGSTCCLASIAMLVGAGVMFSRARRT